MKCKTSNGLHFLKETPFELLVHEFLNVPYTQILTQFMRVNKWWIIHVEDIYSTILFLIDV